MTEKKKTKMAQCLNSKSWQRFAFLLMMAILFVFWYEFLGRDLQIMPKPVNVFGPPKAFGGDMPEREAYRHDDKIDERDSADRPKVEKMTEPRNMSQLSNQTDSDSKGCCDWTVKASNMFPDEIRHVVFIKVHKAASTTVLNVMMRFALSRQLNIMLPAKDHILSQKRTGFQNGRLLKHPPSPPFLFDVLCNHVVFDYCQIRDYFPDDTRYVAIIRSPLEQVVSAFSYYRAVYALPYLRRVPGVLDFLRDQDHCEPKNPLDSYTNNRMSVDMGLPPEQVTNASYVPDFIRQVDTIFYLVLLADRFDESMVLLKRTLRWTTKDVVYFKLNSNMHRGQQMQQLKEANYSKASTTATSGFKNVTLTSANIDADESNATGREWRMQANFRKLDPTIQNKFLNFQRFDVTLYDHFSKLFDHKIAEEGADFLEEVKAFSDIREQVSQFCQDLRKGHKEQFRRWVLNVNSSKWTEPFSLTFEECKILSIPEKKLSEFARKVQTKRLAPLLIPEQ